MINFSQYITEARMAPLYHAASMENIAYILEQGFLPKTVQTASKMNVVGMKHKAGAVGGENFDGVPRRYSGVSFTRNKRFAARWSAASCFLEVDQLALASKYKIVPLQYWQSRYGHWDSSIPEGKKVGDLSSPARDKQEHSEDNEFEEFVITSKPIPNTVIRKLFIPKMSVIHNPDKWKEILANVKTDIEIVYYR